MYHTPTRDLYAMPLMRLMDELSDAVEDLAEERREQEREAEKQRTRAKASVRRPRHHRRR